jgi:hypothetical protein
MTNERTATQAAAGMKAATLRRLAISWVHKSWNNLPQQIVKNAWRKSGGFSYFENDEDSDDDSDDDMDTPLVVEDEEEDDYVDDDDDEEEDNMEEDEDDGFEDDFEQYLL